MNNLFSIMLYIDPGTGSMLIAAISGIIMTLIFSIRGFVYRSLYLISGKRYKGVNDYSDQLVFYNEGANYWNVFKPVLDHYIMSGQKFTYLTSDKNDPGLKMDHTLCAAHYIGKMDHAFLVLNKLKATMCVMTTPQLNILRLKRSKDVKHYCHLAHSPIDVHGYKKFSFDYYDSVLCGNKFQITNLKQLEKERKSIEKQLFKTGCTYYDQFPEVAHSKGDSILLAPTWGDRTFLVRFGESIIEKLLEGKNKVILRPHPQSWISDKEILSSIISKFESEDLLTIDKELDNSISLSKAKTVICDITSGIIYDFIFIHKKPVIAVDFSWGNGGYESSNIKNEPCTKFLLKEAGKTINADDISNINSIIRDLKPISITEKVRDNHIINFGKAGPVAASQILNIYNKL